MYGADELQSILNSLITDCRGLFGDKLSDIRLYGSYARGDQTAYSDIDVLILLDMSDDEARSYLFSVCDIASEIGLAHAGVNLSPHICSRVRYDRLKNFPGFYNNVMAEGVSMYAG